MEIQWTEAQKKKIKGWRMAGVVLFGAVMVSGCVLGCLLFLRPEVSGLEGRELTEFPQFTLSSFLDGSYFSDIALWFSDTYPMRDMLVSADHHVKSLYGIEPDTMMFGLQAEVDEIPEIPDAGEKTRQGDGTGLSSEEGGNEKPESMDPAVKTTEEEKPTGETLAAETPEEGAAVRKVDPPDTKAMEEEFRKQVQQSLYVKDGAAYSLYYFAQDPADTYISAVNRAAAALSGQADVYCLLVPNQSGALLSEEELDSFGGSDQMQAVDYYYAMLRGVKTVDTVRTLREHNDEYLYFRTDHHWTQLGAYYVYENFCEVKGIEPISLEEREMYTFEGFLGTFYAKLKNKKMEENPDTIYAYKPNGTNDMTYWEQDGTEHPWKVVYDVSSWSKSSLYSSFIGGDRPLAVIENPQVTDGSSCLVLKESYGNCFVPLLVDHYQKIYVMDYRYAQVNVLDYVCEQQIDDLILINNIDVISGKSAAEAIDRLLQ